MRRWALGSRNPECLRVCYDRDMKTFIALSSAALLSFSLVHAQAPANTKSSYSSPRTPWGDPDLQGVYTNSNESGIPMSRPPELAGKNPEDVTPQEMARL